MSKFTKGQKHMIAATTFFAFMNLAVKYLDRIPPYEIVFFRALVSLVICYLLLKQAKISPWGKNKKFLVLRGLAGTVSLVLFFYTLQRMPLASAVTIQYLSPIFTIIIASLFLKEHTAPKQLMYFLLAFVGVILVKGFDPRVSLVDLTMGLAAALIVGAAYNLVRKLRKTDHPLVVVFYFPMITIPLIGPFTFIGWVQPTAREWLLLLLVGLLTQLAQVNLTKALQLERASNVSHMVYLGTIYAVGFGLILFQESLPPLALLGIALIVGGVMLGTKNGATA